jgi:hypothetical protein
MRCCPRDHNWVPASAGMTGLTARFDFDREWSWIPDRAGDDGFDGVRF